MLFKMREHFLLATDCVNWQRTALLEAIHEWPTSVGDLRVEAQQKLGWQFAVGVFLCLSVGKRNLGKIVQ